MKKILIVFLAGLTTASCQPPLFASEKNQTPNKSMPVNSDGKKQQVPVQKNTNTHKPKPSPKTYQNYSENRRGFAGIFALP
jgi:hypothetical protein